MFFEFMLHEIPEHSDFIFSKKYSSSEKLIWFQKGDFDLQTTILKYQNSIVQPEAFAIFVGNSSPLNISTHGNFFPWHMVIIVLDNASFCSLLLLVFLL